MGTERKHAALIVLGALLSRTEEKQFALLGSRDMETCTVGPALEIKGYRWTLVSNPEGGRALCTIAIHSRDGKEVEALFGCPDLSLQQFIGMCEELDEETLWGISADVVLNEVVSGEIQKGVHPNE